MRKEVSLSNLRKIRFLIILLLSVSLISLVILVKINLSESEDKITGHALEYNLLTKHVPECGDGVCTEGAESCFTCESDCGSCACTGDGDCTDPGYYCKFTFGECSGDGTCSNPVAPSTADYTPVCGCDDITYNNDNAATNAGISLQFNGVCPSDEEDDGGGGGLPWGKQDADNDGLTNLEDNCPYDDNPEQENSDGDELGDACDPCPEDILDDSDEDGICNSDDNCAGTFNPDQSNSDGDGNGDVCDVCPNDFENDEDSDTICNSEDNCPTMYNPNQEDEDNDGLGNACDPCQYDSTDLCDEDDESDEDGLPLSPPIDGRLLVVENFLPDTYMRESLSENDVVLWESSIGEQHTLTIDVINYELGKIVITVKSHPQTATLSLGEIIYFDTNHNELDDIAIQFNSLSDEADLTVVSLNEEIEANSEYVSSIIDEESNEAVSSEVLSPQPTKKSIFRNILNDKFKILISLVITLLVLVIVIVLSLLNKNKKLERKVRYGKNKIKK